MALLDHKQRNIKKCKHRNCNVKCTYPYKIVDSPWPLPTEYRPYGHHNSFTKNTKTYQIYNIHLYTFGLNWSTHKLNAHKKLKLSISFIQRIDLLMWYTTLKQVNQPKLWFQFITLCQASFLTAAVNVHWILTKHFKSLADNCSFFSIKLSLIYNGSMYMKWFWHYDNRIFQAKN